MQDTSSSMAALSSLQGTVLYSSPGGIRLEYPLHCFPFEFIGNALIYFVVVWLLVLCANVLLNLQPDMLSQGWECLASRNNEDFAGRITRCLSTSHQKV